MVCKTISAAMLLLLLSGCEHTQPWTQRFSVFSSTSSSTAEQFDFNWQLSGDREVAPLQMFSTPKQIWLQFAPQQPIPAIFALEGNAQKLLTYQRQEPYVVLVGEWQQLLFKGASLEARANHQAPQQHTELFTQETVDTTSVALPKATQPFVEPLALEMAPAVPESDFLLSHTPFRAEPSDQTLRQTLKRWAQREGWLFQDQHWELEVDLPIVSAATFSANFNESVEQLMRSTALGTRPLQACFYNNKVMRVISLAQSCDPNEASTFLTQG